MSTFKRRNAGTRFQREQAAAAHRLFKKEPTRPRNIFKNMFRDRQQTEQIDGRKMTSIYIYTVISLLVFILSSVSLSEANKLYKDEEKKYPVSCDKVASDIKKLKRQSIATLIISLFIFLTLASESGRLLVRDSLTENIISWLNIILLLVLCGLCGSLAATWHNVKKHMNTGVACINKSVNAGKFQSISITSSVFSAFLAVFLLLRKVYGNPLNIFSKSGYELVPPREQELTRLAARRGTKNVFHPTAEA